MARLKSFVNGGTLLATDLNNIEDDYECAFGTYKLATFPGVCSPGASVSGGPYIFGTSGGNGGGTGSTEPVWLDPSRYWSAAATSSVNPRTVYYNVSAWGCTAGSPDVAPGVSFTVGLYAVTSVNVSGLPILAASPTTGSTVTFTTPAAGVTFHAYSGDFAAPAAGMFCLGLALSGTTNASSVTVLGGMLLVRQK